MSYFYDVEVCSVTTSLSYIGPMLFYVQLQQAKRVFAMQARGPACDHYLVQLEQDCERFWKNGHQMCEEISLTGNYCIHEVFDNIVPILMSFKFYDFYNLWNSVPYAWFVRYLGLCWTLGVVKCLLSVKTLILCEKIRHLTACEIKFCLLSGICQIYYIPEWFVSVIASSSDWCTWHDRRCPTFARHAASESVQDSSHV